MNKNRERFAFLIVTAILVVIIIFMHKCNGESIVVDNEEFVTHVYDTTFVPGIPDTIPFYDSIQVVTYATITQYADSVIVNTNGTSSEVRTYQTNVNDSLIEGEIYTEISLDSCKVIKQFLNYSPKFPKFITRVDTLKTKETITIEKIKRGLYFGVDIGGNLNTFSAGPKLSLVTKKNMMYNYRYDIVQNTHNAGIAIKLGR